MLFSGVAEAWQLTPPGTNTPFPPYVAAGEVTSTIYRKDTKKLWSAHISIKDKRSIELAKQMLKNYPFCKIIDYNSYQARTCGTTGENIGRQSLAYAVGRLFIEISVIGPVPLELPTLNLKLNQ